MDALIYTYGAVHVREQIARCQQPEHGYIEGHTNATGRIQRGQAQVFCDTCGRWKWTGKLCHLAKTGPYREEL